MAQPEKRFKVGACTASVFVNEIVGKDGKVSIKSVSLQRTYKDKNGNFQNTTSFGVNDIPKAILALMKVYDYLVSDEKAEQVGWLPPRKSGRWNRIWECPKPK